MYNISITIGGNPRTLYEADPGWINQQVNRRQTQGVPVCILVKVQGGDVDMILRTNATCPAGVGSGGGRPPNAKEQRLFDLWKEHHLNDEHFRGPHVMRFLKQAAQLLGMDEPLRGGRRNDVLFIHHSASAAPPYAPQAPRWPSPWTTASSASPSDLYRPFHQSTRS